MLMVELVHMTKDPIKQIAYASKICKNGVQGVTFDEFTENFSDEEAVIYVKKRMQEGHWDVLEFADATFRWSGISRSLSHQLVRHRIASYCQQSQRYVQLDEPSYVTPPSIEGLASMGTESIYHGAMQNIWRAYRQLIDAGVPVEDARFVLPNGCTTDINIKLNFRTMRHFLRLRLGKHAQWEVRNAALETLKILQRYVMICFSDFTILNSVHEDGTRVVVLPSKGDCE